jgi:hypothetical protein
LLAGGRSFYHRVARIIVDGPKRRSISPARSCCCSSPAR